MRQEDGYLLEVNDGFLGSQRTAPRGLAGLAVCVLVLVEEFLDPDSGRPLDGLSERKGEADGGIQHAQAHPEGVLRIDGAQARARCRDRCGVVRKLEREADDGRRKRVKGDRARRRWRRNGGGEGDDGAEERGKEQRRDEPVRKGGEEARIAESICRGIG